MVENSISNNKVYMNVLVFNVTFSWWQWRRRSGRFGGEDGGRVNCVGNGKGADVGPNAVES